VFLPKLTLAHLIRFICTDGPYKVIRHPGYLGTLLIWTGFGLAATNWFVLIFVAGLVTYALIRRIQVEEEVLFERFGVDYQAYADETARYDHSLQSFVVRIVHQLSSSNIYYSNI
jgi:steroid 5-alpha reductase family enzyme